MMRFIFRLSIQWLAVEQLASTLNLAVHALGELLASLPIVHKAMHCRNVVMGCQAVFEKPVIRCGAYPIAGEERQQARLLSSEIVPQRPVQPRPAAAMPATKGSTGSESLIVFWQS
jgi:hypothetical protein